MTGFDIAHADLPNVAKARLPAAYAAAKTALAACSQIDECQDWANKMDALASYAKQAKDEDLQRHAMRIRARAIRRCGELLKAIEDKNRGRPKNSAPDHTNLTRKGAAKDAGLSPHQKVTALRVASVPSEEFEDDVEGETPSSVKALAQRGKKAAPKPLTDLQGRDPEEFAVSTQGQGVLREFAAFAGKHDARVVVRGALPHEYTEMRRHIAAIDRWLDLLAVTMDAL